MKNYYELLEVSEKASPEVIKKAYTTLVKKYHPDLQPDGEKKSAEEKIKEINEAYEVLSNEVKKADYDRKLQSERVREEQAKYSNSNQSTNRQSSSNSTYQYNTNNYGTNYYQNSQTYGSSNTSKQQKRVIRKPHVDDDGFYDFNNFQDDYNNIVNEVYHNAYNEAYNNAYNQAYINNLRNMGFNVQYERPFKKKVKIAFASFCGILIFLVVCFVLWHIPFIRNYFVDLYNSNSIIKLIVDIIINIFKSIFSLFSGK